MKIFAKREFFSIAMDCIIFSRVIIAVLLFKSWRKILKIFSDSTFNGWHLIIIIAMFSYQIKWVFCRVFALTFFSVKASFDVKFKAWFHLEINYTSFRRWSWIICSIFFKRKLKYFNTEKNSKQITIVKSSKPSYFVIQEFYY